jgi:hypothetical protein
VNKNLALNKKGGIGQFAFSDLIFSGLGEEVWEGRPLDLVLRHDKVQHGAGGRPPDLAGLHRALERGAHGHFALDLQVLGRPGASPEGVPGRHGAAVHAGPEKPGHDLRGGDGRRGNLAYGLHQLHFLNARRGKPGI